MKSKKEKSGFISCLGISGLAAVICLALDLICYVISHCSDLFSNLLAGIL